MGVGIEPGRVLLIRVKPRSAASEMQAQPDGSFVARLKSPPVDGKANAELIALVAGHFGVPRAAVSIKTGAGARLKRVVMATS